eukprot:CAMPEP_0201524610 /NCGR_PEP_ID=MMETSP0161_2-20130828/23828_1 /ASSEMBLY_ACC=CAM_ASM_000251 /TAXON_ID=180227 /ORGANISM="Neoparamoeba aestuarina, Strain SoJaBio B1-5/56/2" /LENGTH=219 /DNA_ID=CAMNT_0047924101 /DNA_START=333 /DNA_END=989 /DNA_ORIENTATION=-
MAIRTFIPYFPDDEDADKIADSDYPIIKIPPGYENASWAPVTDVFLTNSEKEYVLINDVCRYLPFTYYDPLSIAPFTTYSSTSSVRGIPADVYVFNSSGYNVTLYVEQSNNSIPLQYVGVTPGITTIYNYHTFVAGAEFDPSFFAVPFTCEPPGKVCDGSGTEDLTVYRYHAPNDFNLADQNGASEVGVVAFVCEAVASNAEPGYDWVSKFKVEVNNSW